MRIYLAIVASFFLMAQEAHAGLLGGLFGGRGGGRGGAEGSIDGEEQSAASGANIPIPDGVKYEKDISYGSDERQKLDVFMPANPVHNAPVIFMVHGGGWHNGDKHNKSVWPNKVAHWVPKGFIFISTNYRMLPDNDVLGQVQDVTKALVFAQEHAAEWGGDPSKFIIMGHSAGAHLIAMITSQYQKSLNAGVKPWLGSIFLDSGALNVTSIMESHHYSMYDDVFGKDPNYWAATSPINFINGRTPPLLAVCSTQRRFSCDEAHAYVEKAMSNGTNAQGLEEDKKHGLISASLGDDPAYTKEIEDFMASLDPEVASYLRR